MTESVLTDDTQVIAIPGPGNFQFSAVQIEDLGATEYTLFTNVVDISGSVAPFQNQLLECVISTVKACQKHPRSENILYRLLLKELKECLMFSGLLKK